MNKWIAIPVIAVLVIGIIVIGYFLWQQTDKLEEAESEIVALEGNVSALQTNLTESEATVSSLGAQLAVANAEIVALEGNVAALQTNLTESEATVSSLGAQLAVANAEIVALEGNVAALQTNLTESEATVSSLGAELAVANAEIVALEGNVAALQTKLTESEAAVSSLEADLHNAQSALWVQENINLALSEELEKVKYPRHFESLAELTDWLYKDDTDTKYADEDIANLSFILQVRALRDGYLLPVRLFVEGEDVYVVNNAVVGDSIYLVWADDDHIEWYTYVAPIPSRPLFPAAANAGIMQWNAPPPMTINEQTSYTAILTTNKGIIKIELFNEYTPITVNNFVFLAEAGFYDNVIFHRIIEGFMIQGGCPLGTGVGGPGYAIVDEFAGYNKNTRATISMANAGPNTGGSQFFINLADNSWLDGKHTVFGRVIDGMDVVDAIGAVETGPGDRPMDNVVMKNVEIIRE
ncbi:MAG: Peptidyl-prolyl cis-trans isomerase B [Dehalococcoidia bacterium]|nr:Peptidyl-prolyl cis-trans isomerase B [Bacillota bacterium]